MQLCIESPNQTFVFYRRPKRERQNHLAKCKMSQTTRLARANAFIALINFDAFKRINDANVARCHTTFQLSLSLYLMYAPRLRCGSVLKFAYAPQSSQPASLHHFNYARFTCKRQCLCYESLAYIRTPPPERNTILSCALFIPTQNTKLRQSRKSFNPTNESF